MTAAALAEPTTPRRPPGDPEDPFRIGYRYVHTVDERGTKTSVMVPLTEEDFLHPQEEDRFLLTDAHSIAVSYLRHAISLACRGRSELRLFSEHRVDWQVPGIPPHGPDVVVFDRFTADWDPMTGTLPVADLGLDTLAVIEVTSEATRHVDLDRKFDEFERVGIPYYLVADLAAPNGVPVLLGFELVGGSYRMMGENPARGYFVPGLAVWVRLQDERVVVADTDGRDIPNSVDLAIAFEIVGVRADAEKARADAATARADAATELAEAVSRRADIQEEIIELQRQRADAEKARADVEKATAEAERQRADELARELAALKARLTTPAPATPEEPA